MPTVGLRIFTVGAKGLAHPALSSDAEVVSRIVEAKSPTREADNGFRFTYPASSIGKTGVGENRGQS